MAVVTIKLSDEDFETIRQIVREEICAERRQEKSEKPPGKVRYLTRLETAAMLRVTTVTLRKYKKLLLLSPTKIGGRVLYEYDTVIHAINDNRFKR
jgi:hypothetical protein